MKNRASASCFELPNLHLHVFIVCLAISCQSTDKMLLRSGFKMMSCTKKLSLLMEQSTSNRLALMVQSFSCSLCNQLNGFLWSRNCKYNRGYVAGYCEHLAQGRSQRVLPTQSWSTKHLHSREAATERRTCENSCRHRHASKPQLEQTLLTARSVDRDVSVGKDVGLKTCLFGVTSYCQTGCASYCADARGQSGKASQSASDD